MAILQDDDTRFRGIEKKIGLFVLAAMAGIFAVIIAIGIRQDFFAGKTRLFFVTESARSIESGMDVKLSGFKVGQVESLELTDAAQVKVTLSILDKYMSWVKTDSTASLVAEGLIGGNVIEVKPGSEKAESLAENNRLAFEREPGLSEVVADLYDEVVPLLEDLDRVVNRMDSVVASLPGTLDKVDSVLASANKSFESLEKVMANDVPVLARTGRETIERANKVVDSVSRTWPISRNIRRPDLEILPLDSYSADSVASNEKNNPGTTE